ncbi:hypothetical protein Gpo141_00004287 [Globisporangium polare]
MDDATPRVTAHGLPRPRTRGARRRIHTPADGSAGSSNNTTTTGFPSLASAAQRPGWIPPKYTNQQQPQFNQLLLDPHDEEKSRLRAEALRGRLQATGLKRSIVQAQLFPEVSANASNQRETRAFSGRPPTSKASVDRASFNMDGDSNNNNSNVDDNRPLVPVLRHPTGGALIPSRPTTTSSLVHSAQGHRPTTMIMKTPPHSARGRPSASSEMAGAEPQKVPMTARDRYYIEKRATTAPAPSPLLLQGNMRRSLKTPSTQSSPGSHSSGSKPSSVHRNRAAEAQQDGGDMARFYAKPASVELPKRHELLSRTNEFKTLTESIAEHLSQQQQQQEHERKDSVGSSSHNVAQHLAPPGSAVPRDSFLYLRRVDSNPYNLALTNHAHINPDDYYTVSRLGVTHFAHNSSEFMLMEKFERENYIYSLIVKLPFFKRYGLWKRFTLWKHALNARKRADALMSLNQNLFILLPHLHDALIQLRHACIDLLQIHLFEFEQQNHIHHQQENQSATATAGDGGNPNPDLPPHQKTFTLTEFSIRLKAQKMESERQVDQFIAQAEIIAKHACEKYLYAFLQGTGFNKPAALNNNIKEPPRRASQLNTPREEARRKSMLAAQPKSDPDEKMTYTERATMRTQCRRMTQFLRVVEFFISDALLRMAISSAERLRREMAKIKTEARGERHANDGNDLVAANRKTSNLNAFAQQRLVATPPLFRVEVNLLSAAPPSIGAIAAGSSRNVGSTARLVRRSSGFLTLSPPPKPPSPTREGSSSSSFSSELLTFAPNTELLRSQVETLIFNGLKAVTNRERLLCNPIFKVYVETSMDDRLGGDDEEGEGGSGELSIESMDLDILIMEDVTFIETLQGINSTLLDAYESAETSCRVLSPFLEKYQANIVFCKQLSDPRYLDSVNAEEFRDLLEKYTKEIQSFDELPDASSCGLLLLDKVKLNAMLKPSPRRCLERLHILIPLVIRHKNECFMQELSASNEQISSIPSSVDEFAATLAYLRQLQAGMDDFDDRYSLLRNLYQLVEDFDVKISDNDQMNAFLVSQKRAQLRTSMELFENSCEQYTTKFGIELEARIPGLASQLSDISKTLAHGSLFQLESNPEDIIRYLSDVTEKLLDLEQVVEKHFYYEKTLALPQTSAFEEMSDVKADLMLKMDLWKALYSWNSTVVQWEKLLFPKEVDAIAITEQIQDYYAQLVAWKKNMSPGMHLLCAHLKAKVDEYRLTMPILTDLRCASFEERHFAELQTLLGFSIRPFDQDRLTSTALTLGKLVKMQLAPFGQHINRIATEATQERMLKEMLDKIVTLWEHMAFEVKPYKDAKDSYVLVSYENIYASLEESLVSMTAILSSKYLAPIKDIALTWQKRLSIFQETLDAWIECQRKWMHLESIFAAPDIQKQLPNEGILFVGVNHFWKDLMRRARDQKNCLKVSGAIFAGVSSNNTATGSTTGSVVISSSGAGHAVLDTMLKHNASLEKIEKSLEDYLETKRGFFPRFYFISNDELLEILAHAKEPQAVQRHLCKCFDALVKLELSDDGNHPSGGATGGGGNSSSTTQDIVAMISPEGERVPFGRNLKARGNVEDWLNAVLSNMKTTLHRCIKSCLLDYQHASREIWLFRHPAQAVAIVSYIIWARECEVCFRSASHDPVREMKLWHQTICTQLSNLTRLVRTSLTRLQRSLVVSLVTTDVHFRDVVEDLVARKVTSADDFIWAQQLRYYWHPEHDECDAMQANCRIKYGYEYMGACTRLVITPLTDRCWMTITGALELRFGAAPSGPAGTGKTETSKDLAKALGILCIVFNCSDQIDYKMMGKIFNGVIQSGSWTCLDEFNRIDIEVLSVVAQQMHVLRHARLTGSHDVYFEGKQVALRDHHVIITMNPGYVGRTELPDNLKVCFRPVAMMVPDYAQIAEILLFAEGFQTAKILSRKVTKLFKLCSEQLSQQPHYDFGMRSVKSVLTIAGALKRVGATASSTSTAASSSSHLDENMLLIRAMYDANIPKFVDEDIPLFRGILRDLFPETLSSSFLGGDMLFGAATGVSNWMTSLEDEVDHQLTLHGLQVAPKWKKKIIELFTTLDVRIGIVQTGASGSGKSTAMHILKESLTTLRDVKAHPSKQFQRVVSFVLNPKSISMGELYGFFHPTTREWTDGLASSILRACITEKSEQLMASSSNSKGGGVVTESPGDGGPFYWVTFDGPIDVLWIESMNTVLDDNMTLCLANGERIKLLPRIHLLFEVLDTASASPATISRLGVVYYHPNHLGWRPYVETWASTLAISMQSSSKDIGAGITKMMVRLNAKHKARVLRYFDMFVDLGFAFLHSHHQTQSKSAAAGSSNTSASTTQKIPIATSDLTFVTTICHIFQSLLLHRVPPQLFAPASAASIPGGSGGSSAAAAAVAALEQQQIRCLDLLFFFSFVWSFGGNLNVDEFKKPFQDFVLKQILAHEQFLSKDLLAINGKIPTPRGMTQVMDNIQDFFIDFTHLSFSPWENLVQDSVPRSIDYHPAMPLFQVLVPTTDVIRYTYLTELLVLDAKKPVFLTGATGSGKSVIMKHLLEVHSQSFEDVSVSSPTPGSPTATESSAPPAATTSYGHVMSIALHFSAQTSSAVTQLSLESKFTKKRKTLLGAPVNKQLVVIFIDDINLPTVERHGAQPPIELLRQYLEFKGFYDRDKFFWKEVADSVLLAVGGLPGGGRHPLCPRFIRHFAAVFCLPSSDEESMRAIFQTIMVAHLSYCTSFSKSVKEMLLQIVDATCQLYLSVARDLLPTPSKCHYLFNLRDVTKLMQGVVLGTRRFCNSSSSSGSNTMTTGSAALGGSLTVDSIAKLWAHESIRVFRDRLVEERDRLCFSEQLAQLANSCLGLSWSVESTYQVGRVTERRRSGDSTTMKPAVSLLFGVVSSNIVNGGGEAGEAEFAGLNYEEISDLKFFEDELDAGMARYNETQRRASDGLQLVFFRDAIVHIVAISRILIQPRGHALLLGMNGMGKRSLTRLCAFLKGYRCFEIEVKKNDGIVDFREDLKAVMMETVLGKKDRGDGVKNSGAAGAGRATATTVLGPSVLLLNDSQLVSDGFLDDINTLLSGGEIPKLFSLEEREKIITEVRAMWSSSDKQKHSQHSTPHHPMLRVRTKKGQQASSAPQSATQSPVEYSRKDCEEFFLAQVQRNMRIVLCLSPMGDTFRARVRKFPSLINCTTIDFFDEWPSNALQYVADRFLSQPMENGANALAQLTKNALGLLCVEMHQSIGFEVVEFFVQHKRRVYITPQHFLDLIALFKSILHEKKGLLEAKLQRLTTGVVKLEETNALVNTLQDELVALQPILVEKAKEAEVLLEQVGVDQAEASKVAARVALDESKVKQQQQEVAACQSDAQADLDLALPALQAAVSALDSLDKKDITEVKGFVKPPQAVQVVMEAVCIMLGEKPDWDTSKRILSRSSFMADLKEYDKDNISQATLKKVRKYIENPEFAVDEVKKVSRAAMSLCMWVHAVDTYARVHKEVAPKRQRLAEMNTVLAEANAKLAAKQNELFKVLESMRILKEKCDATLAEKQRLVDESELTQARLQRAEKLTVGLSDERIRWKNSIGQLKEEGKAVVGNSFLAAACVSYLGPFDGHFRGKIMDHWVAFASDLLEISSDFTLEDAFGDAMELREWQLLGLPSDSVSAENAICIMKGKERWPLMIDPQQQANQWIKRMEVPHDLQIAKSNDSALMKVVEYCLSTGKPLLIEDIVESIEPSLEPVLSRVVVTRKPEDARIATTVKLGDRMIDVDTERFRLYMTTKLANPAFIPDVFIRMNVINFTVTRDGLEDQLLSDVVKKERPEVEERKHALLYSISQDQKLLQQIEIKILSLLSESKGNILDDLELIQALETSKQTSIVVTRRLKESEITKQEVLDIRDHYGMVAARGALLYFVIADLAHLDPMYQYSLEYFSRLFSMSVDEAPASSELARRLENLETHLTVVVYRNICRGLFEAHKLLFSLIICLRVQVMNDELSQHDIHLLNASAVDLDSSTSHDSQRRSSTIGGEPQQRGAGHETGSDKLDTADVLIALGQLCPVFSDLLDSYRREPGAWTRWIASTSPFTTNLPGGWDERLPRFYRLVLIRWLREEALVNAVALYIAQCLGDKFVESENLSMTEIFSDMDKITPCLFILSSGADPKSILDRFAREKAVYDDKYHVISLGQGQGPVAEAMMENCMREGHWLALLNVHLAKSWLPKFQQLLAAIKDERLSNVHEGYRLFLASFPAEYFPIVILQNSVKVICEPPKGIKANLRRSMALLAHHEADPPVSAAEATSKENPPEDNAWVMRIEHQLAFGLSFFHAVIQERAKFGTLGWNLKYDFSDADFLSVLTLQRRLLRGAEASSRKKKLNRHGSVMFDLQQDSGGGIAGANQADDEASSDTEESNNSSSQSQKHRIPWDALHFLTAEIYYGGRVTDEFDRRCLMANLLRFCSAATLSPEGISDDNSMNECPVDPVEQEDRAAMATFVDELPSMDAPFVFGMHPNAHIYFQKQEAERLVGEIAQLQPYMGDRKRSFQTASSSSENAVSNPGDSVEQTVVMMAQEIQQMLPVPRPISESKAATTSQGENGLVDPFVVVLHQELSKCHVLLQYVHERLDAVQKAIRGVVVMSHCIEDVVHSLSIHQVPLEWRRKDGTATVSTFMAFTASATSPPLSHWVNQLLFRYEFLHSWLLKGMPLNNVFPLSIFCFPQGFFTAILQRHARKYLIPIHHLEFQFNVVGRELQAPPDDATTGDDELGKGQEEEEGGDDEDQQRNGGAAIDGAYISGMFLEGAQWNAEKRLLCDPDPGVMHHSMPTIHVLPQSIAGAGAGVATSQPSVQQSSAKAITPTAMGRVKGGSMVGGGPHSPLKSAPVEEESTKKPPLELKYSCPVYKTPTRKGTLSTTGISTNFVLAIDLPCERPSEHYALNGTALVCNINN